MSEDYVVGIDLAEPSHGDDTYKCSECERTTVFNNLVSPTTEPLVEIPCSCGGRMRLEKQNEVK